MSQSALKPFTKFVGAVKRRALVIALAGAVAAPVAWAPIAGAHAQTANALDQSGGQLNSISASDVAAMLKDFDITVEMRPSQRPGGSPLMVATTEGGAKFLVGFLQCDAPAAPAGCRQAMVTTAQSSAGVVFDELNAFNGTANVTTVVYDPKSQILIFGRNIFLPGGVGRENFKLQVALFLNDMNSFAQSRTSGAASVALTRRPNLRGKIDAMGGAAGDAARPDSALLLSADGDIEREIAISNATGVDYSVDVESPR